MAEALQDRPDLGQEVNSSSALLAEVYQDLSRNNSFQSQEANNSNANKELPGLTIVDRGSDKNPLDKYSAVSSESIPLKVGETKLERGDRERPGFGDGNERGKGESGANEILDLLKDGKLSDQDWKAMSSLIKQAHEGGFLNQLQSALNMKLRESGLGISVNIDAKLANVQDIGMISVNIKGLSDGDQRKAITINNSPRVPFDYEPPSFRPRR